MLTIRTAADRGTTRIGWLDSRHTFSFGDYRDPRHTQFRALRVINDDRVAPGQGFGTHPHRDMEIATYVLSGELAHRDSLGHVRGLKPGEWQAMTAGTGLTHSEFNPSATEPVHFLQVWLLPERRGLTPAYDQKQYPEAERLGRWRVALSPDGRDGSLRLHQDAVVSQATVRPGDTLGYDFAPGRGGWLHVATGAVTVNGLPLAAGDGLAVEGEGQIVVEGVEAGEVILFDLA
jgi:redox-sensitive bicupin YhaK (pirin superfamily)